MISQSVSSASCKRDEEINISYIRNQKDWVTVRKPPLQYLVIPPSIRHQSSIVGIIIYLGLQNVITENIFKN